MKKTCLSIGFAFLLLTLTGCGSLLTTNKAAARAVLVGAATQLIEANARNKCARAVAKDPGQAAVLLTVLDAFQKVVDAGNPLPGMMVIESRNLTPGTQAELAPVILPVNVGMANFLAIAQATASGCRQGVNSTTALGPLPGLLK